MGTDYAQRNSQRENWLPSTGAGTLLEQDTKPGHLVTWADAVPLDVCHRGSGSRAHAVVRRRDDRRTRLLRVGKVRKADAFGICHLYLPKAYAKGLDLGTLLI
jgi:hypothetical protein